MGGVNRRKTTIIGVLNPEMEVIGQIIMLNRIKPKTVAIGVSTCVMVEIDQGVG